MTSAKIPFSARDSVASTEIGGALTLSGLALWTRHP